MNIFPEFSTASEVRWDALIFGHLFWNRYFGETPDNPPRGAPSTCSSVLIRGRGYCLMVDPAIRHSAEECYFDLNRRTGLLPEAVTHCFSTHHHFDHWNGLKYFPNAQWLTAKGNAPLIAEAVREAVNRDPGDGLSPAIPAERIQEVSGEFLPGVYALPLPGHTDSLHGIAFRSGKKRILIAADSVMTSGHFADRITEFQPDPAMQKTAASTIADIAESFDLVVPGHDNLIVL
ncbi:MAG: MBL fold metallo-hydrolase [Spirochaetaceae bacterium]|nr:MBL fold metallo-hydrolase [Spirochaetaceae bacterium]